MGSKFFLSVAAKSGVFGTCLLCVEGGAQKNQGCWPCEQASQCGNIVSSATCHIEERESSIWRNSPFVGYSN